MQATSGEESPTPPVLRILWSERLFRIVGLLWILVLPSWWVASSYLSRPVSTLLNFKPDDSDYKGVYSWCAAATEGLGIHCFSDFWTPIRLLGMHTVWENPIYSTHPYPPSGMWVHVLAWWADAVTHQHRLILVVWLCVSALALATPALLTLCGVPRSVRPVVVLFFGLAAWPTLSALDRGTAVAFSIPLIAWMVVSFRKGKGTQLGLAIVLSTALLRPQFALLALLFVPARDWKRLLLTAAGTAVVVLGSFLAWPGDAMRNLTDWWANLREYSGYLGIWSSYPPQFSANKSVWSLTDLAADGPGLIGRFGADARQLLEQNQLIVPIALVLAVSATLLFRGPRMTPMLVLGLVLPLPMLTPGVTFSYYASFVLVLAAAVLVDPLGWQLPMPRRLRLSRGNEWTNGLLDEGDGRPVPTWASWILVLGVGLTLVPIAIPVSDEVESAGAPTAYIGLLWLVIVIVILVTAWLTSTRRAESVSA